MTASPDALARRREQEDRLARIERAEAAVRAAEGEANTWARIVADAMADGGEEDHVDVYVTRYAQERAAERYARAVWATECAETGRHLEIV